MTNKKNLMKVTQRMAMAMTAMIFFIGLTQTLGQSPIDGFSPMVTPQTNGTSAVRSVVIQPNDGKIIIGGRFEQVGGVTQRFLARLNSDGTIDTAFNPIVTGDIHSMVLQPDGKILIGGLFDVLDNGETRTNLVRLNADGSLDTTFSETNVNSTVRTIALQADGKILIGGGSFTMVGGQTRNRIARLNANGTLDMSFDPNANFHVLTIALQSDAKILIGGFFTTVGGQTRNYIARLLPSDGSVDTTFNPIISGGQVPGVSAIVLQEDDKILIGGDFTDIGGVTRNRVARLNTDGSLDTSFDANINSFVLTLAVQSDGKILIGGGFTAYGQPQTSRRHVARVLADGSLDTTFDPNAGNIVHSFAIQPDGKILIGGEYNTISGVSQNFIARFTPEGTLETTFDLSLDDPNDMFSLGVRAVATQPDGKIVMGGDFNIADGVTRNHIARVNPDGSLDTAFDPNTDFDVVAIAVQPDGKIVIGGAFNTIGGVTRKRIARLNADGSLDTSFGDLNLDSDVESVAVQDDGKILIGGRFKEVGGITRKHFVRLNADGTLDTSYNPNVDSLNTNPSSTTSVYAIQIQPDGKSIIAGSFTDIGGVARTYIARLNSDGTLDTTFSSPFTQNRPVYSLAILPDGKILAGGFFTQIDGNPHQGLARLNDDGTLDTTFPDPQVSFQVDTIMVQSDGKIFVGGSIFSVGGTNRENLARLNSDGSLDTSYTDPSIDKKVRSSVLQPDGKILIGGEFFNVDGVDRQFIARLTNNIAAGQNLNVTKTSIAWTRTGSAPIFTKATFELSTDNGATYTPLGSATAGLVAKQNAKDKGGKSALAPQSASYMLDGLDLPSQQNILIRARGFFGAGSIEQKVQPAFLPPATAAAATISGRVFNANGRTVYRAVVKVTDQTGEVRTYITNQFGYYNFSELQVGQTYILEVIHKNYQFSPQVVNLDDNLDQLNFFASP